MTDQPEHADQHADFIDHVVGRPAVSGAMQGLIDRLARRAESA